VARKLALIVIALGAAVAVAVAVAASGLSESSTDDEHTPRRAAARTAPGGEPPLDAVAVVWGADNIHRAARRLARAPWVSHTSVLERGTALLRTSRAGFAIPLDVVAVNPEGYAGVLAKRERRLVRRLRPGRALLSQTSARLRHRRGGELALVGGRRLRIAGVIPDEAAQAAELVVHSREPRVRTVPRNAVAVLRRPGVTAGAVARLAARGARARLASDPRGPTSGGPVRPAELKAKFGEPAVRLPYGSDWVRLDPAFVRRHIVTRNVPVLGAVSCHRAMIRPLRAAMSELRRRGLARLVDPGDYAGCYAPRRISPTGALSLHAWGLAVDLNASRNPFGGRSHQDPRLVRTMERHGFTWGGEWPTVRDPMHFEFRGR
jgi:D-alanyl-D-alanine carboxypeptidase